MNEIIFASGNKAKRAQFQFVANYLKLPSAIVSVYERFPEVKLYSEEYGTQEEIVERGAHEIYAQVKQPIVVEDTILQVDALNGMPGLRSNEYLKKNGRLGLLKELTDATDRSARIVSIVGYYDGKLLVSFKTIVEGSIAREELFKTGEPGWVAPTPENNFGGGFNAVFMVGATGKTLAQMTAEEGLTYGYREPNFNALLRYLAPA